MQGTRNGPRDISRARVAINAIQRSHQAELPEDIVRLGLKGMFQRMRIECNLARGRAEADRAARREREAAEVAEGLSQEADDRVFKIAEQSIFDVKDVDAFLGEPLPSNDGRTPRPTRGRKRKRLYVRTTRPQQDSRRRPRGGRRRQAAQGTW